jgi:hypothetical protein
MGNRPWLSEPDTTTLETGGRRPWLNDNNGRRPWLKDTVRMPELDIGEETPLTRVGGFTAEPVSTLRTTPPTDRVMTTIGQAEPKEEEPIRPPTIGRPAPTTTEVIGRGLASNLAGLSKYSREPQKILREVNQIMRGEQTPTQNLIADIIDLTDPTPITLDIIENPKAAPTMIGEILEGSGKSIGHILAKTKTLEPVVRLLEVVGSAKAGRLEESIFDKYPDIMKQKVEALEKEAGEAFRDAPLGTIVSAAAPSLLALGGGMVGGKALSMAKKTVKKAKQIKGVTKKITEKPKPKPMVEELVKDKTIVEQLTQPTKELPVEKKPVQIPEIKKPEIVKPQVEAKKPTELETVIRKGKRTLRVNETNKGVLGDIRALFRSGGLNVGIPIFEKEVVRAGKFGRGDLVKTKFISSTHEAFKNKGYVPKEMVDLVGRAIKGEPMTELQIQKVKDAFSDYSKFKEDFFKKQPNTAAELKLRVGDEYRVDGEWYRVTDRDISKGEVTVKDGITRTIDEIFDNIDVDESAKGKKFLRRDVPISQTSVVRIEGDPGAFATTTRKVTAKELGIKERAKKPKPKEAVAVTAVKKPVTKELVTALKKEEIKTIRKDTGLGELPDTERKSWERTLSEAKDTKADKTAIATADEVISSKRAVSDTEHAGMVIKASELVNEYDTVIKDISSKIDKGDSGGAKAATIRADAIIDQLDRLTEASDLAGREAARALNIRKMRVNRETYKLAPVVQRAKAVKGQKLSQSETVKFQQLTDRVAKAEKELETVRISQEKLLAEREKLIAERIVNIQSKKAKITKRAKEKKATIRQEREQLKKDIDKALAGKRFAGGLDTETSYLIGKLAFNYIKEGVVTVDAVVRKVLADVPSITERDVWRALNERDPKRQQKARSQAVKTKMEIKKQAKLLEDIAKAEDGVFDKPKKRAPQREEIRILQKKLTELRRQAFKSGMDNKKLERALQTINELQDQLDNQFRNIKKKKPLDSAELKTAKEKAVELRKIMRTEDALSDLNEQLKTGEFKIPETIERKKIPLELEKKQIELKRARRQVREGIQALEPVSFKKVTKKTINTLRTAKATADISATFRQGLIAVLSQPKAFPGALVKQVKSFFSEHTADQVDNAIRSADHHYIREKSKLELSELGERASNKEELFYDNYLTNLPTPVGKAIGAIVKGSDRAMTTFLNIMRTEMFDNFLRKYPNATQAELTSWADWVNVATGKGDVTTGAVARAAGNLSGILFAPRFAVSRVQTPFRFFKDWKTSNPRVRKEIAKDMARLGGTGATVLSMAKLAGLDVGTDPESSDFGKIRVGNTRIDMWAGIQQPMRVLIRLGMYANDQTIGKATGVRLADRDINPLELIGRFSSYKLAPSATIPLELLRGKTMVGEEVTPAQTAVRAMLPLVYEDVYDAYREGGVSRATLATGLSILGVGVNTYKRRKLTRPTRKTR